MFYHEVLAFPYSKDRVSEHITDAGYLPTFATINKRANLITHLTHTNKEVRGYFVQLSDFLLCIVCLSF
jgi:hypothetical protein